jgi:CheY-like chemotaxis protein
VADTLKGEMSKIVLIVEKDLALMRSLREALEHQGFEVEATTDGKGALELVRQRNPACVVLAVDLDAGQNGYIICKKLKSEADLRLVPVIIIGDPKGFEKHQQLKTRAEGYLGKPFEVTALVEQVGGLAGFPVEASLPPVADSFEPALVAPEELALDGAGGAEGLPSGLETEFELVDSLFDDRALATLPGEDLPPPEELEIPVSTDSSELGMLLPPTPLPSAPASALPYQARSTFQSSPSASLDAAEGRELRARVTELTGALEESRSLAAELEGRVRDLELELEAKHSELETTRSAPGKAESKEVFALRDVANKKDKENLRLRGELNAKEQEIVELREKENALEQQASEATGELARRDAQLKAAQARADQLALERKRFDVQLLAAREEARSASARLSTLQTDYDALQARMGELEASLEPSQRGHQDAENARAGVEAVLAEVRGELDSARFQLEERTREVEVARAAQEQAEVELAAQAGSLKHHEERSQRRDGRLRAQQERLDQVKATLQQVVQALEDTPRESEEVEVDELAEA